MVYLLKPLASRWIYCLLFAFFTVASLQSGTPSVTKLNDTFHQDHRQTVKMVFNPNFSMPSVKDETELARAYLVLNAGKFGLSESLENLSLERVQTSLSGRHYRFQQTLDGIAVKGAEIVVSIDRNSGQIYRVANNTYPVKQHTKAPAITISSEDAYDIAWGHLKVRGPLNGEPQVEKFFLPEGDDFRLVYRTLLPVEAPFGSWEHLIDAVSGKIISHRDERITRKPITGELAAYDGLVEHRATAFKTYAGQQALKNQHAKPVSKASGTGMVFDPDPRTTLNDASLTDTSPATAFEAAYFNRDLNDIAFDDTNYSLVGPWAQIVDLEAPNTAPSTTTDGNWTATRGDNAFNDAMTYYHVDVNQRYIQSLGFTGETGIQELSIRIDTDGFNGADNSSYSPALNRLSFGHGCVDDNEDVDVILHEYGHAIHHSINDNWSGGDTGAMGEGFGDYWAGSYSYSTPNGPVFNPNWAFSWDGHNDCWPGRIMNDMAATYDHSSTYPAHQVVNGVNGDQLWSTPLFQAFLTLVNDHSVPRSEVDQIILESHFGLAGGAKMRDLATATVQAAARLFPEGPHSDVFFNSFLNHNIVEIARAQMTNSSWEFTSDLGENGVPDPGEEPTFSISLQNGGTAGATTISAVLSSNTDGVEVLVSDATFTDIAIGESATSANDFQISIGNVVECGSLIDLTLTISFDDGSGRGIVTTEVTHQFRTGVPQGFTQNAQPNVAIPDNTPAGITSTLEVSGVTGVVSEQFNIDMNIVHTWRGDLILDLTSPEGTTVRLHNRAGSSADDIIGNYPGDLASAQPLSAFFGEDPNGTWTLTVSDNVGEDTGTLNSWAINDISGYDCLNPNCAATATASAERNATICAGFPIQLNVNFDGLGEDPAIQWSNPELLNDPSSATPYAILYQTTTFVVTLRGSGCQATAEITINATPGLEGFLPYWQGADYYEPADMNGDNENSVLDMVMFGNTCNGSPEL